MFIIEKKTKIVSVFGRCLRMLLILGLILICIEACSKDDEEIKKDPPPKENPPGEGNQGGGQDTVVAPADSLDADVVSQYLKLVNATKIPGQPPVGGDGAIWNDVKDTLYLMRGLPIGKRVSFLHDPAINITGFYVYVPGASYYYDVPNVPEEAKDSTDVVYVDAEFPVADFIDYPISFPVYLMPYVDGIPFSTFIEPVKIEDPKDPDEADVCSSILVAPGSSGPVWQWESTIRQYNGNILNFWAPGVTVGPNVLLGGCCRDDGVSRLAGDIGCSKIDSLRSLTQTWVEFPANEGLTSLFELLVFNDNGTVVLRGDLDEAKIIPDTRNFCNRTVELAYNLYQRVHNGNHDLTPGGNTVNLQLPPSPEPPVSFLSQNTYELVYTCHTLVLTRGGSEGEEWGFVYRRYFKGDVDIFDFHLDWYDNKNNPFLYWLP